MFEKLDELTVFVIGGGGREHALVWKIAQSPLVKKIFCAPGNPGMIGLAELVPIKSNDIRKLARFAIDAGVELVVVGPEEPLSLAITDYFEFLGIRVFGPSKMAAQIETSKIYAKRLMRRMGIPTAEPWQCFYDYRSALSYIERIGVPCVVKADGLAAGKAAFVCMTLNEAFGAVDRCMIDNEFGYAGQKVVVEEFVPGDRELSCIVFTDGKDILPFEFAHDHKARFDNDQGPNTGGMGAVSASEIAPDELLERIIKKIMHPAIQGMRGDGFSYKGVLYAGIKIDLEGNPIVLEFNARFGDPETQPQLVRMKNDIVPVMLACIDGTLSQCQLEWDPRPAVTVVMVSAGYPGKYEVGKEISGLEYVAEMTDAHVFHAGTKINESGDLVTSGGRVLGVTALGWDLEEAMFNAYYAVDRISFENADCRFDIGKKLLTVL